MHFTSFVCGNSSQSFRWSLVAFQLTGLLGESTLLPAVLLKTHTIALRGFKSRPREDQPPLAWRPLAWATLKERVERVTKVIKYWIYSTSKPFSSLSNAADNQKRGPSQSTLSRITSDLYKISCNNKKSARRERNRATWWLHVSDNLPWDRVLLNPQEAALTNKISSFLEAEGSSVLLCLHKKKNNTRSVTSRGWPIKSLWWREERLFKRRQLWDCR